MVRCDDPSSMVDPLSYFSFKPVPYDWCNKDWYVLPLLLIGKSSPFSGSDRFPHSLSKWSFTVCPMPYNHLSNVLSVSLNKKCPTNVSLFCCCVCCPDIVLAMPSPPVKAPRTRNPKHPLEGNRPVRTHTFYFVYAYSRDYVQALLLGCLG